MLSNATFILATATTATASGESSTGGLNNLVTGIYNYITEFQPLVYMLIAAALIIIGIMFIIPSEKTKQFAQSTIPYVALGAGIILLATQLATEYTSKFVF